MRTNPQPGPRTLHGTTLLETAAALALAGIAAATALAGLKPLACAFEVEAARSSLVGALVEARRLAYATQSNVSLEAHAGDAEARLQPVGHLRGLARDVHFLSTPADGDVQFRASGLAENATLVIGCGDSTASVVVNQRGVIR